MAAAPVWTPLPAEEAYYSIPSPASTQWALLQLFLPLTTAPEDPTFGRAALPRSPGEELLRSEYKYRDGKVVLEEPVLGRGGNWVAYQVWEPKVGAPSKNADILFIHGVNDYGGKLSEHARQFLDAGYRMIIPDLPSHGRSTGIHVHLPDLDLLVDALYAVLVDVIAFDSSTPPSQTDPPPQKRKIFIAGQSLGGFCAALFCLKYGAPVDALPSEESSDVALKPVITGGLFLCPMLVIAADTRPAYIIELIARGISKVAGSFPLAAANKGKNSEDPRLEEQFLRDPQTYHGKLRVATGLAILAAITKLGGIMSQLTVPFSIHHGTGDRVTSYHGSEKLYKEASSTDKKLNLYDGYQHILLRKGKDAADDQRRQNVLGDMLAWLAQH